MPDMTRGQKRQATAESRGSGSDGGVRGDEVGNSGCHENRKKRKRPAIDEQQPGWWPPNYAPGNPRCTRILGGMRSLIRTYQKAGRDPNDMWKEDGEDGCMVEAIRELGQGRVTQRVFKRVKLPFVTVEKPTKRAVGTDKRKLKREGSSAVENNTHDESTDDLANPHSPSCQGDGDESASRDNHSMLEPVRQTISRLRCNYKLWSDDISRCTKVLDPSADKWHIFDPGYPFEESALSQRSLRANNIIFFINAKGHWSLCHLDRENGQLNHYNSLSGIEMPVGNLRSWVLKQPAINPSCGVTIQEKECPQQKDDFNCGIFVLAFLLSLLNGESIPSQVNAQELRMFLAARIEATAPTEPAKPIQKLVFPDHHTSLREIHSVTRGASVPAGPSPPQCLLTESKRFFESLRREEDGLLKEKKRLEERGAKLSSMKDDLNFYQQKLQRSEKVVQDLREQIKNSETTEALHKDIQDWITKCPRGNDFQNKWLNEMKSSTKSTNDSMMAESKLLPEKLRIAEAEYDESHKNIQQLGEQIQSHTKDLEAISNSIEKTKQALAYIKQECAQIAEHNVGNREQR
ncbi:hypothetical protein Forpe1208_v003493 [Fusarium oxysporum f. sp. rapae]|uniref:Ubiquitin-like protease family profile domain-containing protein n=1 Tax=Fusarium oxysporum f. sp. rapae TaxID=485398 RepID=A0A8J5PHN2_FUSOX|nr:hypothetical protein Forpe1208_v003493 [Fusarium oxysporum f. sp. rapae]